MTGLSIPGKQSINHLISGGVAGICAVAVTNPLDVARTRLQLLEVGNPKESEQIRQGFWKIMKNIVKDEGIQGLYKGMKPRIFVKIPGSAIAFLGYEWLKENSLIRDNPSKI